MATGIENAVRALVTSLREEGALVSDPAPWGSRVDVRVTTDVVEVSGPNAGSPRALTWPCLLLFGPQVVPLKRRWRPGTKFETNFDSVARTVQQRTWPRFYDLTFRVEWQTRSGFGTASPTPTSAEAQLLAGIARFDRWAMARRAGLADDVTLFAETLSVPRSPSITSANILSAVGSLRLSGVQEFEGAAVTVAADTTVDLDVQRVNDLPP